MSKVKLGTVESTFRMSVNILVTFPTPVAVFEVRLVVDIQFEMAEDVYLNLITGHREMEIRLENRVTLVPAVTGEFVVVTSLILGMSKHTKRLLLDI